MERERKETNRVAVFCHTILAVILILSYVLEVAKGARTIGYLAVFAVLALAPVVWEWILYIQTPDHKAIEHILGIGYGIFYTFVIFTTNSELAFTFVIPLYLIIILYSDFRFCMLTSVCGFLVNVAFTVYQALAVGIAKEALATYEIRVLLMLIIAVFLCMGTDVMTKINQMKMEEINQEKETASNLLKRVMETSGEMSQGIQDVTQQMEQLGRAVGETRDSMQQVSSGTNETAESVQHQLSQTEEIQKYIEKVEMVSRSINESMDQAKGDIANGKSSLDVLLRQVESSERAGNEVVTDIGALEEYMNNMQSIIELITSVASQTSLLALNASIEAARAGEAGKGFAVVATEISNLANQTQGATVNITDVIHNVSEKLTIAVNAVQQLMDNNNKQNASAATVVESFERITQRTGNIDEQSRMLEKVVHDLAEANNGIVESVQTISAITEEVSAHASETYNISDKNSEIVSQVTALVEELNAQAQSLNAD